MRLNKTRIILIVMIVSTIVLGGVAVFVGWRLQQNQTTQPTNTLAADACDGHGGGGGSCKTVCCQNQGCVVVSCPNGDIEWNGGPGSCPTNTGAPGCTVKAADPTDPKNCGGVYNGGTWCCEGGCVPGRNDLCKCLCTDGKVSNTGQACVEGSCPPGYVLDNKTNQCVIAPPTPPHGTECTENIKCSTDKTRICVNGKCEAAGSAKTTCLNAKGCWNDGRDGIQFMGCTPVDAVWCGPGSCVPGRTDLCKYKCVNSVAVNQNVACVAGSCQYGYCLDIKSNSPSFGECVVGFKDTNDNCKGDAGGNCKKCSCPGGCTLYNGVAECRQNCVSVPCNTTVNACEQLDFNCGDGQDCGGENINLCPNCTNQPSSTPSSSSRSSSRSSSTSSIVPTSLSARAGGRVYCQDTGGQPIPIVGATVAVTVGSTTINATTDSDGYYTSSDFNFPTAGVNVAIDVASLPSTFNNGLSTSQLENKFAENCATPASIPGCSGGVASNYYCNSTAKTSYANCKYTTEGEYRGFKFKYTNCTSPVSVCGDGTVDEGESCDPVGTVGQCTNGGKCLNGCVCPTCNSKCTTNDQCPDGYACSNGSCRNPSCPNSNECSCDSIPSTALFDDNRLSLVFGFVLIVLGIVLLRSKFVIGFLTPALVGVFGTSILKYIDPELAKKEYEKNVIDHEEDMDK